MTGWYSWKKPPGLRQIGTTQLEWEDTQLIILAADIELLAMYCNACKLASVVTATRGRRMRHCLLAPTPEQLPAREDPLHKACVSVVRDRMH
jgi:hypothetical protein